MPPPRGLGPGALPKGGNHRRGSPQPRWNWKPEQPTPEAVWVRERGWGGAEEAGLQGGWKMAVSVLQLAELGLHAAAFLCGVVCAAALTVAQGEFGGWCLLYGTVGWTGTALVPKSFSSVSLCSFVSAVSIVVALYSFSSLLYGVYGCCTEEPRWDRVWLSVALVVAFIILFFLLVAACILRVGLDALCASILQTKAVTSCQEAEHKPWGSPYRPTRFYSNLRSAQASAWVTVFLWGLLTARLLLRRRSEAPFQLLRSHHPERNPEAEALFAGRPVGP
ncbi:transmembrane protein 179B [Phaenicophaeus curvirostris]|uniref:transmembrane protein 179B n=1 Tax=Phaenicophaeus curvirostris TaxID=33595 RepID=UPI0037F0DA75